MTTHDDDPGRWDPPEGEPVPFTTSKTKRSKWPWITGAIGVLFGVALTAGSGNGDTSTNTAAPAPTVTVTAAAATPKTVVKTAVPTACDAALNEADQAISIAGDIMAVASDGFMAVSEGDVDALAEASTSLEDHLPRWTAQLGEYADQRDACRVTP